MVSVGVELVQVVVCFRNCTYVCPLQSQELYEEFKAHFNFVSVYISEAHAQAGVVCWLFQGVVLWRSMGQNVQQQLLDAETSSLLSL